MKSLITYKKLFWLMSSVCLFLLFLLFLFIQPHLIKNKNESQVTKLQKPIDETIATFINESNQTVTKAKYDLGKKQYEYESWRIDYTKTLYRYQMYSSVVLLILSIAVLGCGLFFSYMQFQDRLKNIHPNILEPSNVNDQKENNDEIKTSLRISMAGIEISSSIIGLLILCVSLAFFYLYIANIYPILDPSGKTSGKIPQPLTDESSAPKNEDSKSPKQPENPLKKSTDEQFFNK
jgi:hypothetical protein